VNQARLGQIGCRTDAECASGLEGDIRKGLGQLIGCWFQRIEPASELHAETAERNTRLIHHSGAKVVSPALKNRLTQSWSIPEPAARSIVTDIEAVAAIEKIPASERVTPQRHVIAYHEIKTMERS